MSAAEKSFSKAASRSTPCDPGTGGDKLKTEDQKRSKRRRFYASIMKREIGKAQKARNYNQVRQVSNTGTTRVPL